jgi:hypothetical protein
MAQRTTRSETAAVFLDATQGQFLRYQVSFLGAQAEFAIVDTIGQVVLLSHKTGFSRDWPQPIDSVSQHTNHMAAFHFLLATQYTYVVELRDANGLVRTLIDITYDSTNSSEVEFQGLTVVTV